MKPKIAFIVGHCNSKTKQVLVLRSVQSPVLGPFVLKAVISAN